MQMPSFSRFPKGITHPETTVDFVQFKTACYQVAREVGMQVTGVWKRGESKTKEKTFTYDSYHAAKLNNSWVLCNAQYPYVGFTKTWQPFDKTFIDELELSNHFAYLGKFEVLETAFLNQNFPKERNNEFLAELDESEVRNVLSWSPTKIGDAIFNEWD